MSKLHLCSLLAVLSLTACANGTGSQSLQDSLAADPQLQQPTASPEPTAAPAEENTANVPEDFPEAIPRYEAATWIDTTETEGQGVETRWTSDDPVNFIAQFYRRRLQENGWQLVGDETEGDRTQLTARRDDLELAVSLRPSASDEAGNTELVLAYQPLEADVAQSPSEEPASEETDDADASSSPEPTPTPTPNSSNSSTTFSDLNTVSDPLRPYVRDLAQLGLLSPEPANSQTFSPNAAVTRRQYARWLFESNNRFYANQPAQQLRPAGTEANPAFQDVPTSDRDFAVIQGLAEAGILPSPLSGDETTVQFQPDAPLTREDLLLWKVPLDLRRALPTASLEAVKETWGFQDASRIDPEALRAVLADFQNGDRANVRRAFGYTTLFQPKKTVTRAEAASSLWYFGYQGEGRSAQSLLEDRNNPN